MSNEQDCPKCGTTMVWKYLHIPKCLFCEHIIVLKQDSTTDEYTKHYGTDTDGVRWVTKESAEKHIESAVAQALRDNQCVVELPLHISVEISYGLRSNFMLASEVIAAIEASGARIKP